MAKIIVPNYGEIIIPDSKEFIIPNLGKITQGGMGAGVSDYNLARAVSEDEGYGVVSGTGLDQIMVRRLQLGDPTGEIRSVLEEFPNQGIASWIVDKYYIEGGKASTDRFNRTLFPEFDVNSDNVLTIRNPDLEKLIVAANFVEVKLAKRGHNNPIGINFLHKIQWPLMPSMYGAMLGGVNDLLIGAGFPKEVPKVLDNFLKGESATMAIPVLSEENNKYQIRFDPRDFSSARDIKRPAVVGIVGNHLGLKALPEVDGHIYEGHVAGGHTGPAREKELTDRGEPAYGPKDEMNYRLFQGLLEKNAVARAKKFELDFNNPDIIAFMRQPYWFAGDYADRLNEALENGAQGVQVGTAYAFCEESAISPHLKRKAIQEIMNGANVFTNPKASPSGFPFKLLRSDGTLADIGVYEGRNRTCNLGYLVNLQETKDGIGVRCPAESVKAYVKKGGREEDTEGKMCLCNGLFATVGLGSPNEPPVVTTGSKLKVVKDLVNRYGPVYSARAVTDYVRNNGEMTS